MTRILKGSSRWGDVRTSETHPIEVDYLDMGPWPGKLGLTFAPGKKNESYSHFTWDRDLDVDLKRLLTMMHVDVVVTILEKDEMKWMGIEDLREEVVRHGMESLYFSIPDLGIPPGDEFLEYMEFLRTVMDRLDAGKNVIIHCRGGLGRSGMVAACLLGVRGIPVAESLRCVRRARGEGAVEMPDQEDLGTAPE
jgi:protein-tyrosine phosphatase